jgi:hypothetical protein
MVQDHFPGRSVCILSFLTVVKQINVPTTSSSPSIYEDHVDIKTKVLLGTSLAVS